MKEVKSVSIRIEKDVLDKFRFAAKYYDRSLNSQVNRLIKNFIRDYEKEHGVINVEEIDQEK